jgi:hypothetical protein
LAALLVLATGPAQAKNITVEFEGILTVAMNVPGADAGTPFSGSYSYDDTAVLQVLGPGQGLYDIGIPTSGFSLLIQGATPVAFAGSPLRDIAINDFGASDSMMVTAQTAGGDFLLSVAAGDLFSSLDLVVPDLSGAVGELQYTNLGAGFVVFMGALTSLSAAAAAPEPSSALLLGLAAAALAWRRGLW